MRPEDFSPGNMEWYGHVSQCCACASMRPEDFSPGNAGQGCSDPDLLQEASMRPEDFSPGNISGTHTIQRYRNGFNEAGGFLPRKHQTASQPALRIEESFNEAGGFLPRKPELMEVSAALYRRLQ